MEAARTRGDAGEGGADLLTAVAKVLRSRKYF